MQVATVANQVLNYLTSGEVTRRLGNMHPNVVPHEAFPTSNGHVILAVGNDGQFDRFCAESVDRISQRTSFRDKCCSSAKPPDLKTRNWQH